MKVLECLKTSDKNYPTIKNFQKNLSKMINKTITFIFQEDTMFIREFNQTNETKIDKINKFLSEQFGVKVSANYPKI